MDRSLSSPEEGGAFWWRRQSTRTHMNKGTSASANSQLLLPCLHQPGLVWTGEQTPSRAGGHPLPAPPSVSLPVTSGSGPLGQVPGPGRLLILSSWPQRLEPLQPDDVAALKFLRAG